MRKYYYTNSLLLVVIFLFVTACEGIFVPDPIDPRIPKYTEEGNNVAGAYIDNNIWESVVKIGYLNVSDQPLFTVDQENNSLLLRFSGSTSRKSSSIEFHLKGLNISNFGDLVTLKGQNIQLDGIKNAGYYIENYTPPTYAYKGIGQLYFRNVRIGNSSSRIILSGTFGFSIHDPNGKIIKVSSGRFDYIISENPNFQLQRH